MADNVEPEPPPPPPDEVAVTPPVTPIPPDAPPPRQGCMEKRSTMEKILVVLLIIIIIVCLGFVAAFLIFYFFASPPQGTCLTEECVQSASRLKTYMDTSVKPCNNFYEYACGNWVKKQVLDPDESKISLGTMITDSNRVKIKALLESETKGEAPAYAAKPKVLYKACMNVEKLNERGTEPFLNLVKEVGKFPALESSWNETDFNLPEVLVKLAKIGRFPLVSLAVKRDLTNAAVNKIYVSEASLMLGSAEKYKGERNESPLKNYEKWLIDNFVLLGTDKKSARQDAKEIVELEIRLAKMMRTAVEKEKDYKESYNPMTIAVLNTRYPWLNWLEFIQGVGSNPTGVGVFIGAEELVINLEPDFFQKLGPVLANTTQRVLANYLMSTLLTFTSALGDDFRDLSDEYNRATRGVEPVPRWERCTSDASSVFGDAVGRMYVDEFFSEDAKEKMDILIGDLTSAFTELLEENVWMKEETKEKAEKKLAQMKAKVGYPDDIKDDEKLANKYKLIPAEEDEYMETIIAYRKYLITESIKQLREPADKEQWPENAAKANAFYDVLGNQIIFPAGFLQPPVYSPDYSSSMNYGAIGMVIGHEITHGFDDSGSQYDINGELKNWWTEEDKENFKSRSQCFIDQYGCYKWDGHSIDGRRTLGENIADNGGLKQSYRAYRNFVKRRGSEEPRLPGLSLNHDQIFFLSFAQIWCAKVREEAKKEIASGDPHTPYPYRVLGTLQNSPEFAEAFQCEPGSRMDPLRKCVLW